MAAGRIKWTEKKISALLAEGRGEGHGEHYKPWLDVTMLSSSGRTRRVWSGKTNRVHQLLSDVEYRLFLALEWAYDVADIREQFPLDRNLTLEVARMLGLRHPHYPGTDVPTVMTVDFMVTKVRDGVLTPEAFNAKRTEEAEDENSMCKLEIQRETLLLMEVPHHLVLHSQIPQQKVANIDWIRDSLLRPEESEPRAGYWASLMARMTNAIRSAEPLLPLVDFCADFDAMQGCEQGTGLRVARMLMWERVLVPDLANASLTDGALGNFLVAAVPGKLRAVGGA